MRRVWNTVKRFFCGGAAVTIWSTPMLPILAPQSVQELIQRHRDFVLSPLFVRCLLVAPNMGVAFETKLMNQRQEQYRLELIPCVITPQVCGTDSSTRSF
jgi:hypothetical protein